MEMDNTTQQAQAQREALFDRMIQLGKETESLFEKIEDIEKEIELSDEKSKSTFLKTLNMEHKICMQKKDELIKNILGQLYTGVLVTDKITIRKGGLYNYKKQRWNVELPNFKKVVLENLHEVSNKLSSENLDILEFLLNKIVPVDYNDEVDTDEKIISIPITPPIKMVKSEKWTSSQEINILLTDSISIDSSGEASFRFLNEQCTGIPSNIERLITLKYKKQIDNATNEKTINIQQKINSVNKDIEEIKDKGQNYLALIELQKQPQEQESIYG
jgi:hypothetical protein